MPFDPYAYAESTSEAPASSTAAPTKEFDPYAYASANPKTSPKTQNTTPDSGSRLVGGVEGTLDTMGNMVSAIPAGMAGAAGVVKGLLTPGENAADTGESWMKSIDDFLNKTRVTIGTPEAQQGESTKEGIEGAKQGISAAANAIPYGAEKLNDAIVKGISQPQNPRYQAELSDANAKTQLFGNIAANLGMGAAFKALKTSPASEAEGINASGFENESEGANIPKVKEPDISTPNEELTPPQQQAVSGERNDILHRVGLSNARQSALDNDPKDAATDFQMTKYDQAAGRTMAGQFEHEKDTLTGHAEAIASNTGGTLGMDEDSLANRGSTIARPFDDLRQWFDQKTKQLYDQAQQKSDEMAAHGNPMALSNLQTVQQTLSDPTFANTLMAKDQGGLLKSMQAQLQLFKQNNPNGFTPAAAEQFRQWLNQVWTPDNRWAVGQIVKATDNDVLSSAGENIYGPARAISILKKQTLDNPNGVSDLFDTDPKNPMNRSTAYEKIPDKLSRMPIEQFQTVLKTLQGMPAELQDSAQAAIGEIKAHLANKLTQAGSQTRSGAARNLWNGDAVNNVLSTNGAKFRIAFGDDADALSGIKDLQDAGNILKVDTSYPGADAQAANAMKRGLLSRILPGAAKAGGAATGSIFGGIGAAAGEMAAGSIGDSLGLKAAESAALKAVQKRIVKIKPPSKN